MTGRLSCGCWRSGAGKPADVLGVLRGHHSCDAGFNTMRCVASHQTNKDTLHARIAVIFVLL